MGEVNLQGEDDLLTADIWRTVLKKLPVDALARAACVCRLWHSIAGDPVFLSTRFKEAWKLANIVGRPLSSSFWRDANLSRFAISHTVERWDTVAGLAVKYKVHVIDIKRLNNMISDHGIHSRKRLLIPISHAQMVEGRTGYIEVDPFAKREVVVLYLGDEEELKHRKVDAKIAERFQKTVIDSLKKSLHLDNASVHYYLLMADGDIKKAFSQYNEDLRWERARCETGFSFRSS
ncbi:hypothetical protein KP509_21G027200 [Ceratopteris richardii]|uniref:LysM domain-containing protein n=1 Tax=Ceratopteris richardii TaxID=49495 RepID=A0A8T2S8M4_CERRI|nr:hypothetical protein KP509_21G027200 [Ceratopteris richardii]KAH7314918.1 hypothetical protein KP509_21G027200 [Ceratopteris richardii]KAH7314919.1 hypothetical protein KP509_21G027200 [Ceratopteris richardii]